MTIVFVSNFYNHHQSSICKQFDEQTGGNFFFIETRMMGEHRIKMGWGMQTKPQYVVQSYTDPEAYARCIQLINDADVVIWGGCPIKMIRQRLKKKKLTFAYSERLFKDKSIIKCCLRWIKYFFRLGAYKKNHFLLCASGYAAPDYARIGLFANSCYRWGYFPQVRYYNDVNDIIEGKKKNSILWAGRLIEWKHPEMAIEIAKRLKTDGYNFELNIIGNGILEDQIKGEIEREHLGEYVHMLGSMKPEEVREYMEQSEIFLFTSDQNEGWGAVLNESMNSACAVVADYNIGSVPFLLENNVNGMTFNGKIENLYDKTRHLLENVDKRRELGENAYLSIANEWNAECAVRRFIDLVENMDSGERKHVYVKGPCSMIDF